MTTPPITTRVWIDLFLLALVWGAVFLFVTIALRETPPLWTVFHRVFWAAVALWIVIRARGLAVPRGRRAWGAFLVMGTLANVIPFSLITWGQTEIESGLAAILNASAAFFGVIVAAALLRDEHLTPRRIVGVGLGLAGVAVIVGPGALGGFDPRALGQIAVLGATLSYAFAGVWGRLRLTGLAPVVSAAGMLSMAAPMIALAAWAREGPPDLSLNPATIGALAYMSVIGTGVGYILYYRILAAAGPANLMVVTIIMPPISVLLGWAVLGERLDGGAFTGCGLVILGLIVLDGRAWRRIARRP